MLRKFILLLFIIFISSTSIYSQSSSGSTRSIWSGTSLPSTCQPSGTNIFYKSDSGALYTCTSINTWAVVAGGGSGSGTVTNTGTLTANRFIIGNNGVDVKQSNSVSPAANGTALTVVNYSLTGSNASSLFDLSGTWNTSGNPTLIKANITNTSTGGSALLLDLQVGGISKLNINTEGGITSVGGITSGGQVVSSVSGANNRFGVSGTEAQIIVGGSATSFASYIQANNVFGFDSANWHIGQVPSDGFIDFDTTTSLMRIGVGGRKVTIGDRDNQGNNSYLTVNDTDANLSYQGGNVIFYFGEDTLPTPNISSIFELNTVTRGFLPPRMTTTQRDNIPSPAEGLELYNLTTHLKNYWNGSTWLNGGGGVPSSRTINTTSPLGGGSTLASDLTLTCSTCTTNASSLTSNLPVIGAGSNSTAVGTVQGNTTKFVSYAGSSPFTNDCAKFDSNGNITTAGSACGSGGSGLTIGTTTITSGTATRLLYETSGNLVGEISGLTSNGSTTLVQTSNSSSAFTSGPNGSTNPTFQLDNSTSSAANGVKITSASGGSGVRIDAISSSGSETLMLASKGTANLTLTGSTVVINGLADLSAGGFKSLTSSSGMEDNVTRIGLTLGSVHPLFWTASTPSSSPDSGIVRSTTATIKITDGSTGFGNLLAANTSIFHLIGGGSAPTIVAGAGAGTSPTVSITGTDLAGKLNITSGTLPSVSAVIVTITFNVAYDFAPYCVMWPANTNASVLSFLPYISSTTTTFTVNAATIGLGAATQYLYNFACHQ